MDRETVITHLQIIHTWASFARERDLRFFTPKHLEDIAQWSDDAISLLKEQPEIVRCKDCWKRPYDNCPVYEHMDYITEDDFFCACGERKK